MTALLWCILNLLSEAHKYDTEEAEGLINAASVPISALPGSHSVRHWPLRGPSPHRPQRLRPHIHFPSCGKLRHTFCANDCSTDTFLPDSEKDNCQAVLQGFIILSCLIAVSVNFSTFLVIGTTSPVTYQVLGHLKTCLVLSFGYTLLHDPFTARNILGILVAIFGMALYSVFSVREGKKKSAGDALPVSQVRMAAIDLSAGHGHHILCWRWTAQVLIIFVRGYCRCLTRKRSRWWRPRTTATPKKPTG